MLKLNIGRSRKVPGEEPFSSEGFSCNLEVELAEEVFNDAQVVRASIEELFAEAEQAVDRQVERSRHSTDASEPADAPQKGEGDNGEERATNRQLSYVISLARQHHGMSLRDLEEVCRKVTGESDLSQLSRAECSHVIDALKEGGNGDGQE